MGTQTRKSAAKLKKKVLILDKDRCIGCQYCSMAAPQRLIPDEEDGLVYIEGGTQSGHLQRATLRLDEEDDAREAAGTCPTGALYLDE